MSGRGRLFLVDPMCALDYGHNPQSLIYFGDYFADRGFDVVPLVCRNFPLRGGGYADFVPTFHYYYQNFVPISVQGVIEQSDEALRTMLDRIAAQSDALRPTDELEALATADWLTVLDRMEIGDNDRIFYPSIDYYGFCGLLRALAIHRKRPQVHARFIGVMENATQQTAQPLRTFRALLDRVDAEGRIALSAESPVYAEVLSRALRRNVTTTLYPMKSAVPPMTSSKPFVVYSAGAGRGDKGFFSLFGIIQRYSNLYPDDDVVFKIQNLRPADEERHAGYMSQLYAAPNVELINAVQTDEGMARHYESCHFLLMPYEFEIYRLRGSAIFMEGITKGRPFAITSYTGFHPLVENMDTGYNCGTVEQFCTAIHQCYVASIGEIAARARRTALHFEKLSYASMDAVFADEAAHPVMREASA